MYKIPSITRPTMVQALFTCLSLAWYRGQRLRRALYSDGCKNNHHIKSIIICAELLRFIAPPLNWRAREDLNPYRTVLETAALPLDH